MPELSEDELDRLPKALSGSHHNAYLEHANGCEMRALELYRWNMEISSRFMVSINITETVLQHAISDCILASYGEKWPWSKKFLNGLKMPKRGAYNSRSDIEYWKSKSYTAEAIIPKLKFIFWESMLVRHYDRPIWNLHIKNEFPHSPENYNVGEIRKKLHIELKCMRNFRNKVAHHNPIFLTKLNSEVKRMDMIVRWRCEVTANWMERINPVPNFLNKRPKWLDE